MRIIIPLLAAGLMALSASVFAAASSNECSANLANGKQVATDCKVSMTREDGKARCFVTDEAMDAFVKDVPNVAYMAYVTKAAKAAAAAFGG